LNFICTHNSRRSHLGQIWGAVAATLYEIPKVTTFSGGTEATAFNPRAVFAIERDGFIAENPGGENPRYLISLGPTMSPLTCFSKVHDDPFNRSSDFAAIMTCNHADQHCPVILGSSRISLPYEDPKAADDTIEESARYTERSHQIGREMLAAFQAAKHRL
jgi:arsenate reductase